MQAPKGARGRGRARAASRDTSPRGNRTGESNKRRIPFDGGSSSTPSAAGGLAQQAQTAAGQPRFRNKQLRNHTMPNGNPQANRASSSASSFGSGSLTMDQTWRDPNKENNAAYLKRMSELYQTV